MANSNKDICLTLFFVLNKDTNKVSDIELAFGDNVEEKSRAYMKLKDGLQNQSDNKVILYKEVKDIAESLPAISNYSI